MRMEATNPLKFVIGEKYLDKLKILSFFPHRGSLMSGGERSFIEILKRWAQWGNEIHIITTKEGFSTLKNQGLRFIPYIYHFPTASSSISWYLSIQKIIRKIPKIDFDFVYSNEPYTSIIPAFVAKNKTKAPLVVVFKLLEDHEKKFITNYRNKRKELSIIGSIVESVCVLIRNLLVKRADYVLTVSDYYPELLTKMNIDPKRIQTVRHGADISHISSIKVNDDKLYDASFMGNFIPRKGLFDLIWAWRKVVDKKSDAKLVLIGTGDKLMINKVNSLIRQLKLENNIIQTGWLDDEKFEILKKSKVFVFPSYGEGFALAICEAMACGLPVIAYDLTAYKNIYKKGIIKVKTGDKQKLVESIITILENKNYQKTLSKDAFNQAKKYDWQTSAKNQLNFITHSLNIQKTNEKPRVSIGLPVYNGEKYLAKTLDSLLSQSFSDFEIIISDNASTDNTSKICHEYAAKDSRIHYYRNKRNLGAAKNFNRVFELSSGTYFKWVSYDDLHDPTFLLRCTKVLDQNPSIVLCHSKTARINERGEFVGVYDHKMKIDSYKVHERFRDLISTSNPCWMIFGVIRRSSLMMTNLLGNYIASDRNLLAEIGLIGRIYEISEYLFFRRDHPEAYTNVYYMQDDITPNYQKQLEWWTKTNHIKFPYWKNFFEYIDSIRRFRLKFSEKLLCYFQIIKWFLKEGWLGMSMDVEYVLLHNSRLGRKFASIFKSFLKRTVIPIMKRGS